MDIAVPSRFSCLKPVEDDFGDSKKTDKKKEKSNKKVDKPIRENKKNPSKQVRMRSIFG